MRRFLAVTTAASDLHLLTIDELREAAGISNGSQDASLLAMGLRVAAAIMSECNIAVGSGAEPTLKQETLTETFYGVSAPELSLARRHGVSVTSITEDDVALDPVDHAANPESGILTRLYDDVPGWWRAQKIIVVYQAGFATIPGDLKMAALDFFRSSWLERSRDPLVRRLREDIPGVMEKETDYWVGSLPGQSNEGPVPDLVSGQLARFRNFAIG